MTQIQTQLQLMRTCINLLTDATNTYDIGSTAKKWRHGYFNDLTATSITTQGLAVGDLDPNSSNGNVYYVAKNGDDTHAGQHPKIRLNYYKSTNLARR